MNGIDWYKFPVHAVTSPQVIDQPGFYGRAAALAAGGSTAIHLRAHGMAGKALYDAARRLRELTAEAGAPLLVNDRIDLALAAGADGVHLGARSVPLEAAAVLCRERSLPFGYSCHSLPEALAAERAGAGYLYFGTIFASAAKPGVQPCGTGPLAEICAGVGIPVYGIGGIGPENAGQVAAAGASGAAVISAAWAPGEVDFLSIHQSFLPVREL